MAAQTHINDSHTLGTFRKVVSQRNTVGFNTQLTTRTQTITEVHKMETLLEETLLVLHNLKKPRSKTVWQNWQCNKPRFKNVQAWNTESAATIASIDDLQMIARALPPSAYTPFFQPHP
jgi:hypothetical protein